MNSMRPKALTPTREPLPPLAMRGSGGADRSGGDGSLPGEARRLLLWEGLPLLAALDLLLVLAGSVAAFSLLTLGAAGPLLAAILLGPVWIGGTAACGRLLAGETPGARALLGEIRRHGRAGIALALPFGVVASLLLGTLAIGAGAEGPDWLLAPVAVDALVLVLLATGGTMVFTLAVETDLGGRARWLVALGLAGRNPMPCGGVLAAAVLLAISAANWGPFLASLLAGPGCLLTTAVARRARREATA